MDKHLVNPQSVPPDPPQILLINLKTVMIDKHFCASETTQPHAAKHKGGKRKKSKRKKYKRIRVPKGTSKPSKPKSGPPIGYGHYTIWKSGQAPRSYVGPAPTARDYNPVS